MAAVLARGFRKENKILEYILYIILIQLGWDWMKATTKFNILKVENYICK